MAKILFFPTVDASRSTIAELVVTKSQDKTKRENNMFKCLLVCSILQGIGRVGVPLNPRLTESLASGPMRVAWGIESSLSLSYTSLCDKSHNEGHAKQRRDITTMRLDWLRDCCRESHLGLANRHMVRYGLEAPLWGGGPWSGCVHGLSDLDLSAMIYGYNSTHRACAQG